MGVRRNQASLSASDWAGFIDAVNQTHGVGATAPAYRDFVSLHVAAMTSGQGMMWGVHTMRNMGTVGRNFLAWHRQYLHLFEQRLQQVHASVTVPYWDWIADPTVPPALSDPSLLTQWSVTRDWSPQFMPDQAELDAALAKASFVGFQRSLEAVHGAVHDAVGGTMAGSGSPGDPLFWLHHANVDRLWDQWHTAHPKALPPNRGEVLQPAQWNGAAFFGMKVSTLTSIGPLGYSYG
jgi:tyrosinase